MLKEAIYRPSYAPTTALPFGARSVGHYVINENHLERRKVVHFTQLYWGIEGEGLFEIEGEQHVLKPNQICFFYEGDPHILEARTPQWKYRWLTVDGELSLPVVKAFSFNKTPTHAGPCPEELFLRLTREIRDHTPHGQRLASATAYTILAIASGVSKPSDDEISIPEQCVRLIRENYADPDFDINELADMLRLNRSRLSRVFKEEIGTTLKDYLVACRLQKALSMLKETSIPIATVASECGYNSADYFAKAIRQATGYSPREFRNM